ncbi:hypothetical protein ACWD4B_30320 [Streptomyces sp. NPDC002536]
MTDVRSCNRVEGSSAELIVQAGGDVVLYDQRGPVEPPTPHEVPGCTGLFVNRDGELLDLGEWLVPGTGPTRIIVISGLKGIGTSSVVRRWVELESGRYPGGELYVDFAALRGPSGACDVSEGLARCLRTSFGVTKDFLPATLAERTNLYRTHAARSGPLLVVLDDVTLPAQIRPFIPAAPGSAVLVTSSRRLDELIGDGARLMPLKPLDAASGALLLAKVCGENRVAAEREAAERLVELCGGLPIALTIVATRLARRSRLGFAALVDELAHEDSRLAALTGGERSVSAAVSLTCSDLSAEALRLYRRLALLPGRAFDAETAAALTGCSVATAQPLLEELDDASLLEDAVGEFRYTLHDLVRLHARSLAEQDEPEEEREAAVRRVIDLHVVRAAFADRAIMGKRLRITDHDVVLAGHEDPFTGPGARDAALARLEAERADLLAAVRVAHARGLDQQAWQLAESLTALYFHHRHLADWIESGTLGADSATRLGARDAEARLRSLVSRPLTDVGDAGRAREQIERAVELAEESAHPVLRASVPEFAGRYWDHFDKARALTWYELSLQRNIEAGEPRGAALARLFMGSTLLASGEHERALTTLQEAYEQLAECKDVRMAGRALAALGHAHDGLGREDEAVHTLERAAGMLNATQAVFYEAQVCEELADIARRRTDRAAERCHLERALEIHEAGGSPHAEDLRKRLDGRDA